MPSLCLNMIVKNESHIIKETLENICQYFDLDYWVISDTGSTDNTQEIIEAFFKEKNIPGKMYQAKWKDFAHNRNLALKACKDVADYVLFFDADDRLEGELNLPELTADAYYFNFLEEDRIHRYARRLLIKNQQKLKWQGVLHEALVLVNDQEELKNDYLIGNYVVVSRHIGDRNKNPNKALNDAKVLEKAYAKEKDIDLRKRYAYYCGRSYTDLALKQDKYWKNATNWYLKCVNLPDTQHIEDEKYLSDERLGMIAEQQGDQAQALRYFQQGTHRDPKRVECWYHLARLNHWQKNYQIAYDFAKTAQETTINHPYRMFLNQQIYSYWCHYEVLVLAWRLGKMEESYQIFKQYFHVFPNNVMENLAVIFPSYQIDIAQDSVENVQKLTAKLKQKNMHYLIENVNTQLLAKN